MSTYRRQGTAPSANRPAPRFPATTGGLYDLDALDEDLVTATAPSSSAYHDAMEPNLDNLRSLNRSKATFREMIRAAEADAANHAARMQSFNESRSASAATGGGGGGGGRGGGGGGAGGGREYSSWRERLERRKKWDAKSELLKKEAATIVSNLNTPIEGTQAEVASERLARWQRALELYVYCPEETGVDLLKLLEKLIEGCGEVSLSYLLSHTRQPWLALGGTFQ
jgi:hypothetical protein